jgi:hypothetical protein
MLLAGQGAIQEQFDSFIRTLPDALETKQIAIRGLVILRITVCSFPCPSVF